jgi:glucose-6-phosphate 1-epimerase
LFVFVCLQKTKIHDFGACLVSYKTGTGRECIFVSRDAKLDGSKAIRGGCPLVFPQFGQSDKSMPQHGFLRVNFWKADESTMYDNEDGAGITYTLDLKDVEQARGGKWDENTSYDCTCLFHVKIYSQSFSTKLEIKNTGENEFEFQTLLHTYYLVDGKAALDGSKCYVKGLEGTHVFIFVFSQTTLILSLRRQLFIFLEISLYKRKKKLLYVRYLNCLFFIYYRLFLFG